MPVNGARLGLQAEIADGSGTLHANDGAGSRYIVEPKWSYPISAQVGRLINGSAMIYGGVGYAAERNSVMFASPTILSFSIYHREEGLLIGGGRDV